MKITYLFRERRTGNFSIEELFGNISGEVAKHRPVAQYICKSADRLSNIWDVRSLQSDVYHITGDVNYLTLGLPSKQTLITLHDLGYYENPVNRGYRKWIYEWLWLRLPFQRSRYITTVSEFTKSKLAHYFPQYASKCRVVPNPVNEAFTFREHEFNTEQANILLIGTGAHKNFERLFEAVIGLPVKLTIVGRLNDTQKTYLQKHQIPYENPYSVSTEALIEIYHKADIRFFASLYEGFGMPIIEANAIGLPVMTSKVASMPEVAADAAILVDPLSVDEIRKGVMELIHSKDLRSELISKGLVNAQKYTVASIARQYLHLYDQIGT